MKRFACIALALVCLMLGGCDSLFSGSYVSVERYEEQPVKNDTEEITVSRYAQLLQAMQDLIEDGAESAVIYVVDYQEDLLEADLAKVVDKVLSENPIAAYAVEKVDYELGTNSGKAAVAVDISYLHGRYELLRLQHYKTVDDAVPAITGALDSCDPGVVFLIEQYTDTDFSQLVEDYAEENPQTVMELPEVSAVIYPEAGSSRVVELKFTYQTSRESLRSMQSQVQPVFASAALYVSGDSQDHEKLSQLCSFLMERYDYKIETSITPTYSLLRHGVGDCKAFALVYASMCRRAGLECLTVAGTRAGEAWYWNIVKDGEAWFHVDLLSPDGAGFRELSDEEMESYVWDYSAYPVCGTVEEPEETTIPTETAPDETAGPTQAEPEETGENAG